MPELVLIRTRHDVLPERLALLRAGRRFPIVMSALAAAVHVALAFSLSRAPRPTPSAAAPEPIELVVPEPTAPPPPPPPPPEPAPSDPVSPSTKAAAPAAAPPPAAAAQALTQTAPPEQPVDFSDELVIGTTAAYQGGTTAAGHARPSQGPAVARPAAASSGTGSTPSRAAGAEDRSRAAAVVGGLDWRCPFPEEADAAGVDRALAKIRVDLDATGRVRDVSVLADPGNGFGRAAQRCARGKRFVPALDRDGRAVATRVVVGVRFVR